MIELNFTINGLSNEAKNYTTSYRYYYLSNHMFVLLIDYSFMYQKSNSKFFVRNENSKIQCGKMYQ